MLGHPLLDVLDGNPAVVGAEKVAEHFLGGFQRDRPTHEVGISPDPGEGALKLADIRGDPVGEELQYLLGNVLGPHVLDLGLQNTDPQLVVGRVDIGDQAPT